LEQRNELSYLVGEGGAGVTGVRVSSCTASEQTDSVAGAERRHILQSQFCLTSFTSCAQALSACSYIVFHCSTVVDSGLSSLSPIRSRYPGEEGISPSTSEGTSSGELCADSYIIRSNDQGGNIR
jgi:hypothetical protein